MPLLEEDIRDSVIGNVGTKISMRIGTTDAEFLEKQFAPTFTAQDLENLPNRTAVAALLINGVPAKPFTIRNGQFAAGKLRTNRRHEEAFV